MSRTAGVLVAAGAVLMSSCALTTHPQPIKQFFLPPTRAMEVAAEPILDPPAPPAPFYANELPAMPEPVAPIPRPTDADFLIKKADDSFADGKKALEAGDAADARASFDRAIEALLSAPENMPERSRVERRLDELIEAIYRYDADQSSAADPGQVIYDPSPKDEMAELTFSGADARTRSHVLDLIHSTASQLPLEQHDTVIGAVNYFTSERGKKIIAAGLRRQGRFRPMIERILAEEGVPQELIFLAQAESGYYPHAKSNKMCVGLWQFSRSTGHDYGLVVTAATDDRMDPEKSTRAAARYLKDLYTHFGDWYLAMAAYDCGPACVDHAVMRTGYADFFELRRLNVLPKETANYVPVILAMTIIGKNAPDYGLDQLDVESPVETDSIELESPTHLALIADAIDRPLSELKDINPGLLKSVAPAGYTVHVPKGTLSEVETAFSIVPPNKRDSWRLHRVSTGDSFALLAKRYNSQTASVSLANHEALPEPGSLVAIPVSYPGDRVAPKSSSKLASKKSTVAKHRTQAPAVAAVKSHKMAPKQGVKKTTAPQRSARVHRTTSAHTPGA